MDSLVKLCYLVTNNYNIKLIFLNHLMDDDAAVIEIESDFIIYSQQSKSI